MYYKLWKRNRCNKKDFQNFGINCEHWKFCTCLMTKLLINVPCSSLKRTAPVTKNYHVLCPISKLSTPFWKILYASYSNLSKELKNGIEILIGPVVFKLWIKIVKILFWSITQEPLNLPKFQCYFWVGFTIHYKMYMLFLKRCWYFWDRAQNMPSFG